MATTTPANVFPKGIKPFAERRHPKVICMFDVDGTLTPARLQGSKEMLDSLKRLRGYTATAFVGGSDFKKIEWQLEILNEKSTFDHQEEEKVIAEAQSSTTGITVSPRMD